MQRRAAPRPSGPSYRPQTGANSGGGGSSSDDVNNYRGAKRKSGSGGASPVVTIVLICVLLLLALIVSIFFPVQLKRVEHEAGILAHKAMEVEHDLAQRAMQAEHDVAEKLLGTTSTTLQPQQPSQQIGADTFAANGIPADMEERLQASHAATARMEAQSSSSSSSSSSNGRSWVEGEKKLKQKLQVLYDRQQQGLDLGVPVLTRWLGDDFPAYVTPDMDINVEEWKKQVEEKYAEMRNEEEEWQAKMNKIIQQRERDIGITTA